MRSPALRGDEWCPGEDSNLHRIAPTRPSSVRVYQFRHLGIVDDEKEMNTRPKRACLPVRSPAKRDFAMECSMKERLAECSKDVPSEQVPKQFSVDARVFRFTSSPTALIARRRALPAWSASIKGKDGSWKENSSFAFRASLLLRPPEKLLTRHPRGDPSEFLDGPLFFCRRGAAVALPKLEKLLLTLAPCMDFALSDAGHRRSESGLENCRGVAEEKEGGRKRKSSQVYVHVRDVLMY
jgi:hypothetical protein